MALHNDIDPLPNHRVEKIKILTKPFFKIKPIVSGLQSKLANAIFLFKTISVSLIGKSGLVLNKTKIMVLSFLNGLRPYWVHISVGFVALIAVTSNLIVKYAKADYSLTYPEPASEIAVAAVIDPYTPLIGKDGIAAEKAYQNSGGAFIALNNTVDTALTSREEPLPDNSSATVKYTVADGDNLTTLGWKFGVKISTLMYLNDIDNANLVKPGQVLKIPPKGYEVSATAIAKKEKEKQLASSIRSTVTRNSSSSRTAYASSSSVSYKAGSSKNGYPWGYCTYYVASKRYVPSNWGNAKNWLGSAKRSGYSTGSEPAVGSIGVTPESWWGHVVFVENVSGNMVTFSEMNAVGWGKVSRRTLPVSSFRGFIY